MPSTSSCVQIQRLTYFLANRTKVEAVSLSVCLSVDVTHALRLNSTS